MLKVHFLFFMYQSVFSSCKKIAFTKGVLICKRCLSFLFLTQNFMNTYDIAAI